MADDFDFAAVNAQVTEYLDKQRDSGDSAAADGGSPAPSPSSITPPTTPPASNTAAPSATPAVDDGIEVEFEPGKVQKLTKDEIKQGMLRQADYTRKTQELATARKQAEDILQRGQQFEQEREQLRQVLSDPRALMYLAQQQLAQAQGPQFDPDAPATMATIQQLAQYNQQQLQQQLALVEQNAGNAAAQARQEAVDEIVARQETAKHSDVINAKLTTIYESNPVLQSVPEIEDVIRYRVSQMQPQTIDEALKAFEKVSGEVAAAMGEKFNNARKEQVLTKQKLVQGGIEPPGGAAVPANAPTSFRDPKTNVIDWSKLSGAAAAYIDGARK
jgi:hypothetical protein